MARRSRGALLAALLTMSALGACTETNIAAPEQSKEGWVYFASDRADNVFQIYRASGDGRYLERLTHDAAHNDRAPVVSHDGRQVAFEREIRQSNGVVDVELWVMNADGSGPHAVVTNGSENRTPSWTADDASLVYASYLSGNWEIFRSPLSGGPAVNLTNSPFADQYPRVSPDGSRIAFQTNRDYNFEIYSMRIDGSDVRNLTNSPTDDRFPTWTPDGAHIVWSRFVESFGIFEMDADGSHVRTIVDTPDEETNPVISPDGLSVAYQRRLNDVFQIFVAPLGGGSGRPLLKASSSAGSDHDPYWGL